MLFNSLPFIFVFLPLTMLGFHVLGRFGRRPVIAWLALCSVYFYAHWSHVFVYLLLGSILVNYGMAWAISRAPEQSRGRRWLMAAGIAVNLAGLFYFKYLYKLLMLIHALHVKAPLPHTILLPLGISFFTFTQISYLVDLAEGQADRQDLLSYVLFVTFFPHLIAGPILHHKEMMPQFGKEPGQSSMRLPTGALGVTTRPHARRFKLRADDVSLGLTWFVMGLAKKVLIADQLAPTADLAFANTGSLTAAGAWTGLIVYSMQLYFDFSGYSDMALGLARIFSIRFPLNFNSPYKATSITEFWQRWHMTLTRYITLYLYNPLMMAVQRRRVAAGKKASRKALATPGGFLAIVAYPTIVTMLLTGLWHGAGVQFLLFGLIHGMYLTASQAWRHFRHLIHIASTPSKPHGLKRLAMMAGVYLQVSFALIFFRADSLRSALALLADMFGAHGRGRVGSLLEGSLAFALFPVVWFLPNTQQILGQESNAPALADTPLVVRDKPRTLFPRLRWKPNLAWAMFMAALLFAVLVELDRSATFLYFQF